MLSVPSDFSIIEDFLFGLIFFRIFAFSALCARNAVIW